MRRVTFIIDNASTDSSIDLIPRIGGRHSKFICPMKSSGDENIYDAARKRPVRGSHCNKSVAHTQVLAERHEDRDQRESSFIPVDTRIYRKFDFRTDMFVSVANLT